MTAEHEETFSVHMGTMAYTNYQTPYWYSFSSEILICISDPLDPLCNDLHTSEYMKLFSFSQQEVEVWL